ncbi:MAG TPA: DUF4147 domain-containing protein [Pirellulaceae bacterium]|nr:DUF4147 domain-containing protein [Pirellulaceae bacterium]
MSKTQPKTPPARPTLSWTRSLRDDAQAIFQASVDAVRAERLIGETVSIDRQHLKIGKFVVDLRKFQRLIVIGGGKASGYMAKALLDVLGPEITRTKSVTGWINVPEGGDLGSLEGVTLFPARPAGENLPTQNVVIGTQHICEMVASMRKGDLAICLISGGGSALLAQPVPGVSLEDKRRVSQLLSQRRADIAQLNRVRRQLSMVKGGRLAALRTGGRLIALMISDVLGDPMDLIASGPTVASPDDPQSALDVFRELEIPDDEIPPSVLQHLQQAIAHPTTGQPESLADVQNVIIGNLAVAVQSAARCAQQLGYEVQSSLQTDRRESVGATALWLAQKLREAPDRLQCLIYGGEPVIDVGQHPGRGGRNQHLVLQTLDLILKQSESDSGGLRTFCVLSGGTDGEDGNTSKAGAWCDSLLANEVKQQGVNPAHYLDAYNAFDFFARLGGHIDIGPTHTNVGDVRILLTH